MQVYLFRNNHIILKNKLSIQIAIKNQYFSYINVSTYVILLLVFLISFMKVHSLIFFKVNFVRPEIMTSPWTVLDRLVQKSTICISVDE